jgi:hypothetical protein
MRDDPFLRFHRTAEAAGYPALLIVSGLCLSLVMSAVALLALTPGVFGLAFAMLNLAVAVAILSGAILATIGDVEDPEPRKAALPSAGPHATIVMPIAAERRSAEPASADRRAA